MSRPAPVLAALYLVVALAAVMLPLMPFGLAADTPLAPDLLFAVTAAWVLRRPDSLPVFVILPVFLAADLVLGRPPGLWTVLVLAATEILRVQAPGQNDRPFLVEWLNLAVILAAMLAATVIALKIAFVAHPGPRLIVELYLATLAVYPLAVLLLYAGLGVRAPGAQRSARLGRVG